MLLNLSKPNRNRQKALPVGQVEDHDDAIGTLVVGIRDGAIPLLSGCVPDLQLDGRLVDLESAETEINTDRADVVLLEAIILKWEGS